MNSLNYGKFNNMNKYKKFMLLSAAGAISTFGLYYIYKLFAKKQIQSNCDKKLRLLTLSEKEAVERASRVSDLNYNLFIQFNPDVDNVVYGNVYEGCVSVDFNLSDQSKSIFLDFVGKVNSIEVNGETVGKDAHTGERIIIEKEFLRLNFNRIVINFENHYSHDNKGLNYFHDKSDYKSYVFTNLEPFFAHLLFPCFNQPSLKANIKFSCSSPEDWTVISSANLASISKLSADIITAKKVLTETNYLSLPVINKQYVISQFEETEKIPVHFFGITAGHLEKISEYSFVNVYTRSSIVKKDYNYTTIAHTISESYDLLKSEISSEFSLKNINVCFVPNLDTHSTPAKGCFLLNEDLLTSETSDESGEKKISFNKLMLHLHLISLTAQLWFGIKMTPEWWGDLWLNKALSVFLSFHCLKLLSDTVSFFWLNFLLLYLKNLF